MGLYFRHSVKLGPIRLNISKSGVGVSAGVRGFRYGIRANGTEYIHYGAYGVYVREEIRSGTRRRALETPTSQETNGPTTTYSTTCAEALQRTSASQLASLLTKLQGRVRVDVIVAMTVIPICIATLFGNVVVGIGTAVVGIIILCWAFRWESRRRTITLHFSASDAALKVQKAVIDAINSIASCNGVWTTLSSTAVTTLMGFKHNAGASALVNRTSARVGEAAPSGVQADLPIPAIRALSRTLYFLPDGILVEDSTGIGHVPYVSLSFQPSMSRFIEASPPSDATIVGSTWQHPNKDGGPDRRFANNFEIPICQYSEITIRSQHGLLIYLQMSRKDAAASLVRAMSEVVRTVNQSRFEEALDPWVEVNPEYFQSPGQAFRGLVGDVAQLAIDAVRSADKALEVVSGQGNSILFNFLRILFVAVVGATTGIVITLLVRVLM